DATCGTGTRRHARALAARSYEPKRHFIRATDVSKIVDVLVGSTDRNQIGTNRRHARAIVALVQWVVLIDEPGGPPSDIVDAPRPENLLEAGIRERIEGRSHVSELVEVEDNREITSERLEYRAHEGLAHHRIRVAEHDDVAAGKHKTSVIHQMLMVVAAHR